MKKTIKTFKVQTVHNILAVAKYGKMDDADKIKVFKIVRKLTAKATEYSDHVKDAIEKFKPEVEGFDEKNEKYQRYVQMTRTKDFKPEDLPMGPAEADAFKRDVLDPYDKTLTEAIKEFGEKEVDIEFEPISESAFEKLMSSNDWNFAQAVEIGEFIVS